MSDEAAVEALARVLNPDAAWEEDPFDPSMGFMRSVQNQSRARARDLLGLFSAHPEHVPTEARAAIRREALEEARELIRRHGDMAAGQLDNLIARARAVEAQQIESID